MRLRCRPHGVVEPRWSGCGAVLAEGRPSRHCLLQPGHRLRLIYRPRRDDGRRDGRKSFSWRDYRDLLIVAHQQLGGPIVLIWDNLSVHKAADQREWAETRDWPTIYHLPPYAPDLTPSKAAGHSCDADGSPTSPSAPPNTSSSASDAAHGISSTATTA